MPYLDNPPPWLLGMIVAGLIGAIVFGSQIYSLITSYPSRSRKPTTLAPRYKARSNRSNRSNRSARSSAVQPVQTVQPVQPAEPIAPIAQSPAGQLPESLAELTALARAITLITQGASEQTALELSFSVSKGGGAGWKRAKQLLDSATKLAR